MFTRFTAALQRLGRRLHPPNQWIATDGDGFTVHSVGGREHRVTWGDVKRITARKRDEWSTDLICLDFDCVDGEGLRFVHEDLPGYAEMVRILEATLPVDPDWDAKVAQPPFAPNVTVLYERSAPGDAGSSASG